MDYIFKNKDGEKTVGEITYLHITPFYEFEIEMNNQKLRCYLEHLSLFVIIQEPLRELIFMT